MMSQILIVFVQTKKINGYIVCSLIKVQMDGKNLKAFTVACLFCFKLVKDMTFGHAIGLL